jgi:hypothetical protein
MRLLVSLLALTASTSALAGGIGPVVTGGFHTEKLYYYSNTNESGELLDDPDDYPQFETNQALGNVGAGLEILLGDRDNRVQGVFRGYWNMDFPQGDPAKDGQVTDPDTIVAARREDLRHVGIGSVGIQIALAGDPALQKPVLNIAAHVGSGFLTNDRTEFAFAQIGPAVTWRLGRSLNLWGEIDYTIRFRKVPSHGATGSVGLRVMFD